MNPDQSRRATSPSDVKSQAFISTKITRMNPILEAADFLPRWHKQNASNPIAGHDEAGAWHGSVFAQFSRPVFPIVVDANILRNCIGRSAKQGSNTVLHSLANRNNAHVYCAPHVVDELHEHLHEWAAAYDVSSDAYRAVFEKEYRPLLRVVPTDGLKHMLTFLERERIANLEVRDPDDVPTAILALAMGAILVTTDHGPWETVYCRKPNADELQNWLRLLVNVGDFTEATMIMSRMDMSLATVLITMYYAGEAVFRKSPKIFVTALLLAISAAWVPREQYSRVWRTVKGGAEIYDEAIVRPYALAEAFLRPYLPPFPEWECIVRETSRDASLARACLHRLARAPRLLKASQIAEGLARLSIGRDPMRVGKVLRRFTAFYQPYESIWQVGQPLTFLDRKSAAI